MENVVAKFLEWVWELAERYILPWVIIRDYEKGVVLFLGKYHYSLSPGFNWKIPLLHESLTCLSKKETLEFKPISVVTKDGQVIAIGLIGGYEVMDEKKFLLEANDAVSNIMHHFTLICSDVITDSTLTDLLSKTTPYTKMKNKINDELEYLGAKFFTIGYSSICKTRPISLINS